MFKSQESWLSGEPKISKLNFEKKPWRKIDQKPERSQTIAEIDSDTNPQQFYLVGNGRRLKQQQQYFPFLASMLKRLVLQRDSKKLLQYENILKSK